MTTFNTGNPLGSTDVYDRYDNSENLDNFSNGPADAYPDRFGVSRQSLQGIRNASQYVNLGPYVAGLVFTSLNQVFSYDAGSGAEFYAPGPAITLPYTTTGAGAGEIANFRSVGDAVLRQDLADGSDPAKGAELIGYKGRTVSAVLDEVFNVLSYGATGDGVVDDTAAIAAAISAMKAAGGGVLRIPTGARCKVSTADTNFACVWIDFDNCTIDGGGEVFTTQNAAVPIHVSATADLSASPAAGAIIKNFHCRGIKVTGTGVFEYFALAKGRGILMRRVSDSSVTDCTVRGMSMIGICTEYGTGNFLISRNRVADCKYTAINFNGRAYQSVISDNICSGSNANVNSVAIQVNGPCNITGNTVYGDTVNYANCGGIMWGEGPSDGMGNISGNIVAHCRFGIKSIYHGSCNISGNTLINCRTTGGITMIGGTSGGYSVESSHNLVGNNLLANCAPYQIECSAPNCNIVGNTLRNIAAPVSPSATTEPDAVLAVTVQAAIRVRAAGVSIVGNRIDGAVRGIVTTLGTTDGAISGNTVQNCSSANFAMEGDSGQFVTVAMRDRVSIGSGAFIDRVFSNSIPTSGYFPLASTWRPASYTIGQPVGAVVLQARIDALAATALSGATTIDIVGLANFSAGVNSKVGVKLDNGTYHWTTISANSGNTITLLTAIPAGRTAPSGNPVYVDVWRTEAVLA